MPLNNPNTAEAVGDIRKRRGKKKPKDYRSRLSDPGQRATIPDEVLRRLNPDLYRRRMENKRLASPFVEGSPLTNRDIARERAAEERLRYGPQEADLARQVAEAERYGTQRQGQITSWFDQYKNELNTARAAQDKQYADAIAQVQGTIAQSQTAADTERARIDAEQRASAEARGQTYTGTGGAEAAGAQESRRSLQDAFIGLLTASGAAQNAYLGARQGVGSAAQLTERQREAARQAGEREEFGRARTEIAREKGAFRTQYLSERRERERQNVLENAAFGLDVQKAEQDASEAAAKIKADERKDRQRTAKERRQARERRTRERRQFEAQHGVSPEAWDRMTPEQRAQQQRQWEKDSNYRRPRAGRDEDTGLTPAEQRAERNRVAGVRQKSGKLVERVEAVKGQLGQARWRDSEGNLQPRPRGQEAKNYFVGKGYDPAIVDAAAELRDPATGHKLRPETARRLQALGMRIPRSWLPSRSRGAERTGGN